jgi:uncharacterized coiled-coil protein SlyX
MIKTDPNRVFTMVETLINECEDTIEELNNVITTQEERLAEQTLGIEAVQARYDALSNQIDELTAAKNTAEDERDAFALRLARNTGPLVSVATSRKSAKIPDPPLLDNEQDPLFKDWLLAMKQKLEANADHYDSPTLRVAYVASRCEGTARKHITTRLREGALNQYTDSDDMMKHLETIFSDPNRARIARRKYHDLVMKPTEKFHAFLSEFMYLAAEAGVDEDLWKEDLFNRLPFKLQELMITTYNDDTKKFKEFTDLCARTANVNEGISKRRRPFTPGHVGAASATNASRAASTSVPVKSETPEPRRSRNATMDPDTRVRLMAEGKCFNCFEPGHLSKNCPRKTLTQLKALEKPIETLEATEKEGSPKKDQV